MVDIIAILRKISNNCLTCSGHGHPPAIGVSPFHRFVQCLGSPGLGRPQAILIPPCRRLFHRLRGTGLGGPQALHIPPCRRLFHRLRGTGLGRTQALHIPAGLCLLPSLPCSPFCMSPATCRNASTAKTGADTGPEGCGAPAVFPSPCLDLQRLQS